MAMNIRHLRRVSHPLASYLRVGHRDAGLMAKLLEQGLPTGAGVIVDPAAQARTRDLRSVALQNGSEVILDTKGVELSTVGGFSSPNVAGLPWAGTEPHTPAALAAHGSDAAEAVAEFAVEHGVTGVLAPTHFLDNDGAWLAVDLELVGHLRRHLDANGAGATAIYYPLVASLRLLRDSAYSTRIVAGLGDAIRQRHVDGVFLRVQGFGTPKAGPLNLRRYIEIARGLHALRVPLVGERTGTIGVALAAFGAIGGVESAITYGDVYDARRLNKPPDGKGFVPPPRVYVPGVMAMVTKQEAVAMLNRRGVARLACQQPCCRRDRSSMTEDPRRHFVVSRAGELSWLSSRPALDRAEEFLTTKLMPARDSAAQLARLIPALSSQRNRLDDWYLALRRTLDEDLAQAERSIALVPTGNRLARGA